MGMAFMCEGCKTVYLEGDTIVPQCARRSPEEDRLTGWPLVMAWLGMIGGAWVVCGAVLYGLAWVFQ